MISIIILTYNNLDLTKKCLIALFKNTPKEFLNDIVVIDNCSTDETVDFLKTQTSLKVTYNNENIGFSKGNNLGVKKADGEILIFLNLDTEVQKGWLEPIIHIFKENKTVGAVGVKLLFPNGFVQHAGVVISEDHIPRHLYYQGKPDKPGVNKKREFKAVTAACVAIRKKAFDEVGGFSEEYQNGLEDVDICLKIRHIGYKIIYCPDSTVIHHESVSADRFKYNKDNYKIYMDRWGNEEPDEHKYLAEDGFNKIQIFWHDLKSMAYSRGQNAKTPKLIKFLIYIYIPLQKICIAIKLLIKGDFKTLNDKINKVVRHA